MWPPNTITILWPGPSITFFDLLQFQVKSKRPGTSYSALFALLVEAAERRR